MSIRKKRGELIRLQEIFEEEASRFHDLSLSILYFTQQEPNTRKFAPSNHGVMLWQYYGLLDLKREDSIDRLVNNIRTSNLKKAGLRGAQLSAFALLEGDRVSRFVKMATRAGKIFSERESNKIRSRAEKYIRSNNPDQTSVFVANTHPLSIWLNLVLNHLGKTHPVYLTEEVKIEIDPFAASLSAIDHLLDSKLVYQSPPSTRLENHKFKVALSFPGEKRPFVKEIAEALRLELGEDAVFYDSFYKPHLARPNLDTLLQKIYWDNSDLIVVFLCSEYVEKQWCGLEWRAIRDLIKEQDDKKIMILRFDNARVAGLFGIDGYLDIDKNTPENVAQAILVRSGAGATGFGA